jgi:preprotein translocase subunit SecD
MYKNLRWKFLTILAVTALAVALFWPPWTKVHRGIDLQGGLHLVLAVQTDDAVKLETETTADQLKEALKAANVTPSAVNVTSSTTFVVEGVPTASDSQFRTIADQQTAQMFNRDSLNNTYTFTMKPNIKVQHEEGAVTQSIQTIDRRVNELGVSEPNIAPYGTHGNQIIVELPGQVDVARAQQLIGETARLELRLVDSIAPDQATLLQPFGGTKPPDTDVLTGTAGVHGDNTTQFFLVKHVPVITGSDLSNAKPGLDSFNTPNVRFTLKSQGVTKFSAATGANVGKQLAIVLDDKVITAPNILGPINTADAEITGSFSQQEAEDLALVLRTGALPAKLTYQEKLEVGPTLGADSIRAGVTASLIGLSLVTAFMLLYYKLSGINAFVSIVLNLLILLGFMSYLGAVMTLPGIAGFILTIGMGVDSNVLIFERIREELAANKGPRQAVAAGFDRVWTTIVDTHVSSLISAAFLFQFGSGPIRGFATTLFFGLIANVFTAVFVSRTLFEFLLSRKPAGAMKLSI